MPRGFINASVSDSDATAFLIEDGRIVLTGNEQEVRDALKEQDEIIDLKGQYVCPGLTDSYTHLLEIGFWMSALSLKNCTEWGMLAAAISSRLKDPNQYPWVIGTDCAGSVFDAEKKTPRECLDSLSQSVPVVLCRSREHLFVNSKAMELAGITPQKEEWTETQDGILEGNAAEAVFQAMPKLDAEHARRYILKAAEECSRKGITSVCSDDFISLSQDYRPVLDALEQLSYQQKLPVRIAEICSFSSAEEFASFLDEGYSMDMGNAFFRIRQLKLDIDGTLEDHTAALNRPYSGEPDNKGTLAYSTRQLREIVELAHHCNTGVLCFAQGDRAVDQVLRVYENTVMEGNPLNDGIAAVEIMHESQAEKIAAVNLNYIYCDSAVKETEQQLKEALGRRRADAGIPVQELFEKTRFSSGSWSEYQVFDILHSIQQKSSGSRESLDQKQSLQAWTSGVHDSLYPNERTGKLEPGYTADFIVLNHSPLSADRTDAQVMMTVVNGKTVYEK